MVIIKLFSSISFIVNITMNIPSCKSFMKFFYICCLLIHIDNVPLIKLY